MQNTQNTQNTQNSPLMVKLGTSKKGGFYNIDINKEYTTIREGRMPHLVLTYLDQLEKDFPANINGFCGLNFLSKMLYDSPISDELSFDDYGYQKSLDSLLKDFKKANLVTGYVGKSNWATVKITALGKQFLKLNVVASESTSDLAA